MDIILQFLKTTYGAWLAAGVVTPVVSMFASACMGRWSRTLHLAEAFRLAALPLGLLCLINGLRIFLNDYNEELANASSLIGAIIALLIVLTGILLGFLFLRIHTHFLKEYIERHFNKFGNQRKNNTIRALYVLLAPLGVLLIFSVVLHLFNVDVSSKLIALGGLSVAIGFALQSLLGDVFSGLSLAIDTPFREDDLIKIGSDQRIYQVKHRGLRVTTARDIATHEVVYLPNQKLTQDELVDITRPTDDLRAVITVGVPYAADLREVRTILTDIANGHPHVIGAFPAKEQAISSKVLRLFIRGIHNESVQHFIELARLEAESELNQRLRVFIEDLENWADEIDEMEDKGFDKIEKVALEKTANALDQGFRDISSLTTEWLILFRNGIAGGRQRPDDNYISRKEIRPWTPELDPKKDSKSIRSALEAENGDSILSDSTETLSDHSNAKIEQLIERLHKTLERASAMGRTQPEIEYSEQWPQIPGSPDEIKSSGERCAWPLKGVSYLEQTRNLLYNFSLAHEIVLSSAVPTETRANSKAYAARYEDIKAIELLYFELGKKLKEALRNAVRWISDFDSFPYDPTKPLKDYFTSELVNADAKAGFDIGECRSRSEDLFLSHNAIKRILDHPINVLIAGVITDLDERNDMATTLSIWGDKTSQLKEKIDAAGKALRRARSTTIDTKLRDLAVWIRNDFKDPNPSWKYPIAPVEDFGDSCIEMSMKFYIDNVRMERYLRPFNTFTQIRLRIHERLKNAGINIPFPQRDLHFKGFPGGTVDSELSGNPSSENEA